MSDTPTVQVPAPSDTLGVAKKFRTGTDRGEEPAVTLARAQPLMERLGITRIANLTGLDRIGVPVVAVHRPNSRSLAVSQGKGATLLAAQVSGLMESIESYHAEHVAIPLFHGGYGELRHRHRMVDVDGLPRLSVGCFHPDMPLLWAAGTDLFTGSRVLVPYEMVHTDFRLPLPTGSGAFVMSSNGLASGNHLLEAISHAICELVERDANALWHLSGCDNQERRRLDLATVDDDTCRAVLERFDGAGVGALVWETTSDVGIASFICTLVDREGCAPWPMIPISGSGCHPRRAIALLRALTEAAQGRLTLVSGSRDDLSERVFEASESRLRCARMLARLAARGPRVGFRDTPDRDNATFDADVEIELSSLARAGIREVVAIDLSMPDLKIPVVRVVIPGLETMSELRGYVPGRRGRRAAEGAAQ